MEEVGGDIWGFAHAGKVDALCVLTNMTVAGGKLIMGGGQAREARTRFPALPDYWGKIYTNDHRRRHIALYEPRFHGFAADHWAVVSFPTKYHPSEDSKLRLIETSALELVKMADLRHWQAVVLPRPGCGLGGLKWDEVRPVLSPILDDRFTVITNVEG